MSTNILMFISSTISRALGSELEGVLRDQMRVGLSQMLDQAGGDDSGAELVAARQAPGHQQATQRGLGHSERRHPGYRHRDERRPGSIGRRDAARRRPRALRATGDHPLNK